MLQTPVIDIDDVVSFQCRRCPEHSTQDESISDPNPTKGSNMFPGGNVDDSMSCLCNAGFFFEEGARARGVMAVPSSLGW